MVSCSSRRVSIFSPPCYSSTPYNLILVDIILVNVLHKVLYLQVHGDGVKINKFDLESWLRLEQMLAV